MARDKSADLAALYKLVQYEAPRPMPRRDLSPDREGKITEVESFSQDKPTFRADKPLMYKRGGSVRGTGCATKGVRKCKVY